MEKDIEEDTDPGLGKTETNLLQQFSQKHLHVNKKYNHCDCRDYRYVSNIQPKASDLNDKIEGK